MSELSRRAQELGTENAFVVLAEVEKLITRGEEVVSFCIGQPDFNTPDHVRLAAVRAITEGRTGYTAATGIRPLREAVAAYFSETRGVSVTADEVVCGCGAKPFIAYSILSATDQGEGHEVIFPNPGFPIYDSQVRACGAVPVPLPLRQARDFTFDLDELRAKVNEKTRLLILSSPHNPTGGVLSADDLAGIAEIVAPFEQLWILSDEIYSCLAYDAPFRSIASIPGMRDRTILVDSVSKTYRGGVQALRDVQLRVHPGEVFGLLGPNGAGKSTLVKVLMTIVKPSGCKGRMLGARIGDKSVLARVGYLPEHLRFPDYLTGEQVVDHFGAMAGVPKRQRAKKSDELLKIVGMNDWKRDRVRSYSKGMKQRLGVAQSLINDPDLVLLDEPTDGVDPLGRKEIRDIIHRMKGEGKTVFVNSHLLSELELICDRVAIMVKGEVVQQGAISDLTADSVRYEFRLSVSEGEDEQAVIASALDIHKETIEHTPGVVRTTVADVHEIQPMIDALRANKVTIHSIRPTRSSVEDLFMSAVSTGGGGPGGIQRKRGVVKNQNTGGRS